MGRCCRTGMTALRRPPSACPGQVFHPSPLAPAFDCCNVQTSCRSASQPGLTIFLAACCIRYIVKAAESTIFGSGRILVHS